MCDLSTGLTRFDDYVYCSKCCKELEICTECSDTLGDGSCSECLEIQRTKGRYEKPQGKEENKMKHKIVTVCDGETWGDLHHATVIVFPAEQLPMLDWADKLPRGEYEGEELWDYKEYDLDEYIHMQVMESLIQHGIKNEETRKHIEIHGSPFDETK